MTTPNASPRVPSYLAWLAAVIGVVLIVVAIVYFVTPADSLPGFFPGHQAGSAHHHTTHGVAALVVGLIALVGAWMATGRKQPTTRA